TCAHSLGARHESSRLRDATQDLVRSRCSLFSQHIWEGRMRKVLIAFAIILLLPSAALAKGGGGGGGGGHGGHGGHGGGWSGGHSMSRGARMSSGPPGMTAARINGPPGRRHTERMSRSTRIGGPATHAAMSR